MNQRTNRTMCASHMEGFSLVCLYWDEVDGVGKRQGKRAQLDTSTPKGAILISNFFKKFRTCFLDTVVTCDGVLAVYDLHEATPEQVSLFDRTTMQNAVRVGVGETVPVNRNRPINQERLVTSKAGVK